MGQQHLRATYYVGLVIAALALASVACNLSSGPDASTERAAPTQPPQATSFPTATIMIASPTPFVTQTPRPTNTPTSVPCWPQTSWPIYTVQPGDTLATIAARIGVTSDFLALANCLANPNIIFVNQQLYVPNLPPTPIPTAIPTNTPLPDPNQPQFTDALTVERHWTGFAGQWITYSQAVRVDAGEVRNALRVNFFVSDLSTGSNAVFIGQDDSPWDGAFVDYTFPHVGTYTFQAVAENEIRSAVSTVFTIQYDPSFVPPEGQYNLLTFTPVLGYDGNWHTLPAQSTVMIQWPHAPVGALRVDFMLMPLDGSGISYPIGTDTSPGDGVMIRWSVPLGAVGQLEAIATMPGGGDVRSRIANVRANQ